MNLRPPTPEFAEGASTWPGDLDRREFLRMMAASAALAGATGCARPARGLAPFVAQPAGPLPGTKVYFATAMLQEGFGRGILVESHEGRPTKIEGNPEHSESLGATDAITQAAILGLYDPDRSVAPLRGAELAAWTDFEEAWIARAALLSPRSGSGLALLTEPTTSPTLLRGIGRLLEKFPEAIWCQHTPLARYDLDGSQEDLAPGAASVIFSIGSDFLCSHPAALRYAREFTASRRQPAGAPSTPRLYALESSWSLTGSMADERLARSPERIRRLLDALSELFASGVLSGAGRSNPAAAQNGLELAETQFVEALARELTGSGTRALVVAGPEQPDEIRRWARAMNGRLGADGHTLRYVAPVRSDRAKGCRGDLGTFLDALASGKITDAVILGTNPGYTAGARQRAELARGLSSAAFSLHVGAYADESAALCQWHLPESHFLECWSDALGYDGSALIQQPLIEPMHLTRSAAEIIGFLATAEARPSLEWVRETWSARMPAHDFDDRWRGWLNRGVIDPFPASEPVSRRPADSLSKLAGHAPETDASDSNSFTLLFRADPHLADGRWANNGWLQELPQPFTSLVWDQALLISPEDASRIGLSDGSVVVVEVESRSLRIPVWSVPGHAGGCAVLFLGGGRSRAGSVGTGRGADAYYLRTPAAAWESARATVRPTGEIKELTSTQHHFRMEGRSPVRVVYGDAGIRANPSTDSPARAASLYPEWPGSRPAWGMSIDLASCLGCSACVIACQAENNTPVVGPEQVARGREMHWIRIDRYFEEISGRTVALSQPVPCMHCENAPCELVCPVGATVHSQEGLNEMVYNRCVGTRYCSNNCPYKVRRFNFFDFRTPSGSPLHLQENPDVTVRARGVMEKCSYCVQRIEEVRIVAEREKRPIGRGEIRTACQQACPAEAIVFGDISDPQSLVSQRKRMPGDYALLGELNTRPRTTYLPKVFRPAHVLTLAASPV